MTTNRLHTPLHLFLTPFLRKLAYTCGDMCGDVCVFAVGVCVYSQQQQQQMYACSPLVGACICYSIRIGTKRVYWLEHWVRLLLTAEGPLH
jgi:hypothetical protein